MTHAISYFQKHFMKPLTRDLGLPHLPSYINLPSLQNPPFSSEEKKCIIFQNCNPFTNLFGPFLINSFIMHECKWPPFRGRQVEFTYAQQLLFLKVAMIHTHKDKFKNYTETLQVFMRGRDPFVFIFEEFYSLDVSFPPLNPMIVF